MYFKSLALIQSESVTKSLGMNTNAFFYPSVRMGQALSESRDEGQSRIEITFKASNKVGEDEILEPMFYLRARLELNRAERALDSVNGLCWYISHNELLTNF